MKLKKLYKEKTIQLKIKAVSCTLGGVDFKEQQPK